MFVKVSSAPVKNLMVIGFVTVVGSSVKTALIARIVRLLKNSKNGKRG